MEADDWYRIQANWPELLDGLNWDYIKDDLFSAQVITKTDEQTIDALLTDRDKNKRCLETLKLQPPEKHAYWHLCCSLEKHQPHLKTLLEQTVVKPHPDDAPSLEDIVRQALLANYVERAGTSVKLSLIRETVEKATDDRQIMLAWNDKQFSDFVLSVFSGRVTYTKGRGKIPPHFTNLVRRSVQVAAPLPPAAQSSLPSPPVSKEPSSSQGIENMSVAQVQKYLEPIFANLDINSSIIKDFEKHHINGRVFLTLEKTDVQELFPQLKFGEVKLLLFEIERLKSSQNRLAPQAEEAQEQQKPPSSNLPLATSQDDDVPGGGTWEMYPDYFRGFNRPVKPAERYVTGRKLTVEPGSRHSMLYPSRRFVLLDPSTENVAEQIALETLPFAAALINDRRNGTIYFGVSPETTDTHEEGQIVGMAVDKEECTEVLTHFISRAFSGAQKSIALVSIHDPKFVPTTTSEAVPSTLHVVEIDIEPSSSRVRNEVVVLDSKVFRDKRRRRRELIYYRLVEGKPKALSDEEVSKFVNEKEELTKQRAEEEQKHRPRKNAENLREKFCNLFTGGLETLQDDVYPVLMFSPLDGDVDTEYIRQNLSFIRFLYQEASAIFDFDPLSDSKGLFSFP